MSLCFVSSTPLGNFSKNESLQTDGFALSGFGGEYSGAYFITEHFGVGGNIRYTSNTLDDDAARNMLLEELPDNVAPEDVQVGIGLWKQASLVAGPYFSLPFSQLSLDAYALIGINFLMPPEMRVAATVDEEFYERSLKVQSVNYALDAGIAIRYHFNESYSLRFFSSYFQSKASGEIREEIGTGAEESDQNLTIQSLNFGIGIVYRL